jgi:hypothetical protein
MPAFVSSGCSLVAGRRTPLLELLRRGAFPDEPSRPPLEAGFYAGGDWRNGLEAKILPMRDDYTAVVVQDTADLWLRWPAETAATAADV